MTKKKAILIIKDVPESVKFMSAKKLILDSRNFPKIRISGGEPTVWNHLPELLQFIVDNKNNHVSVLSNGIKLSSKSYFKSL